MPVKLRKAHVYNFGQLNTVMTPHATGYWGNLILAPRQSSVSREVITRKKSFSCNPSNASAKYGIPLTVSRIRRWERWWWHGVENELVVGSKSCQVLKYEHHLESPLKEHPGLDDIKCSRDANELFVITRSWGWHILSVNWHNSSFLPFLFFLGGGVMGGLLGAFEHIARMLTGFVSV